MNMRTAALSAKYKASFFETVSSLGRTGGICDVLTAATGKAASGIVPRSNGRAGGVGAWTGKGVAGGSASASTGAATGDGAARASAVAAGRALARRTLVKLAIGLLATITGLIVGAPSSDAGAPSRRNVARSFESSEPSSAARPTYSTLTRAVPAPLKSSASATREETSITRPP